MKKGFSTRIYNSFEINLDRFSYSFILLIPIINALADVTIYYFQTDETKGLHPGIFRGFLLLFFAFYILFRKMSDISINRLILFYLIYLFILILFSSNFVNSFQTGYIKWFVAYLMFPTGYYYINNLHRLKKLNISMIYAGMIICLNYIIAQFTKTGFSAYAEDTFYLGGAGVGVTNQLSLITIFTIYLFYDRRSLRPYAKMFFTLFIVISIIIVIVAMKRASIFGLIIGFVVYSYFCAKKTKLFKYSIFIGLFAVLSFPIIETIVLERFQARMVKLENREELREKELKYVWSEIKEGNIAQVLFGTEAFNSRQFFGPKHFGGDRMIHGDFASFLYGTGLVGILIYFYLFYSLLKINRNQQIFLGNILIYNELTAIFYGVVACTFLISITGSGTIGERSMVYLYLGAISGVKHSAIATKERFMITQYKLNKKT